MGEWSEYFEDFPEENPANYDSSGRFNPNGAAAERAAESKLRQDQAKLDAEIRAIVQKHRPPAADKK
ncbi:MAG: hypothetical protein JNN09_09380 [Alphaproteobacteria bacterium]|nr:hypothetical protein [Alphaproteobacteria bacterium]